MIKLREDGSNCNACFLKGCDCECETCVAARERNNILDSNTLDFLNLMEAFNLKGGELPNATKISSKSHS